MEVRILSQAVTRLGKAMLDPGLQAVFEERRAEAVVAAARVVARRKQI